MREIEFKMEREGLVEIGQEYEVSEGRLPSSSYYTLEPALAMSANFQFRERLKSTKGVVKAINETPRGFFVTVAFEEPGPNS